MDASKLRTSAQKSKMTAGMQNARDIVEGGKEGGQTIRRFLVASSSYYIILSHAKALRPLNFERSTVTNQLNVAVLIWAPLLGASKESKHI
jgi:hypothetical protein